MGRRAYAAYSVVFVVVFGFLYHVPPRYLMVTVVLVLFPGDEVDLLEQFLLVMLEFPDHGLRYIVFGTMCRVKKVFAGVNLCQRSNYDRVLIDMGEVCSVRFGTDG